MSTPAKPASRAPLILSIVFGVALVVAIALLFLKPSVALFGATAEEHNSQSLRSIAPAEEVVLMVLGVEGIDEKHQNGTFLGIEIPGSGRALFMKYGFDAKLGIDGEAVEITQTGEKSFLITIPEFIVIGVADQHFELAVADNEVLSWTTPQISESEMINSIVSADFEQEYLEDNEETLKAQAKVFYSGIVQAVAPDVTLEFEFAQ